MVRSLLPASRRRLHGWLPASVVALRGYSLRTCADDAIAGVTVGLVALPLAMAFAISSGMTPQAGIYCAIVTGFLISALGGSMVQIGGPTGAFVVVVSGVVTDHGARGLRPELMLTLLSPTLTVAMLGAIESLMSAVVADRMTGSRASHASMSSAAAPTSSRTRGSRSP